MSGCIKTRDSGIESAIRDLHGQLKQAEVTLGELSELGELTHSQRVVAYRYLQNIRVLFSRPMVQRARRTVLAPYERWWEEHYSALFERVKEIDNQRTRYAVMRACEEVYKLKMVDCVINEALGEIEYYLYALAGELPPLWELYGEEWDYQKYLELKERFDDKEESSKSQAARDVR
jgi:hypothetical protein